MRNFLSVLIAVLAIVIGFSSIAVAEEYTAEQLELMEAMKDNITEIRLSFVKDDPNYGDWFDPEKLLNSAIEYMADDRGRAFLEDESSFSFSVPVENRQFEAVLDGVFPGKYIVEARAIGNPVANESEGWVTKKSYFVAISSLEVVKNKRNFLKLSFVPAGNPVRLIVAEGDFPEQDDVSIEGMISYEYMGNSYEFSVYPYTNNGFLMVDTFIPWGSTNLRFDYFGQQGQLIENTFTIKPLTVTDGEVEPSETGQNQTLVEMEIEFPE
jgi:hypothetical protein